MPLVFMIALIQKCSARKYFPRTKEDSCYWTSLFSCCHVNISIVIRISSPASGFWGAVLKREECSFPWYNGRIRRDTTQNSDRHLRNNIRMCKVHICDLLTNVPKDNLLQVGHNTSVKKIIDSRSLTYETRLKTVNGCFNKKYCMLYNKICFAMYTST